MGSYMSVLTYLSSQPGGMCEATPVNIRRHSRMPGPSGRPNNSKRHTYDSGGMFAPSFCSVPLLVLLRMARGGAN